jgi:hypothetical protein
MAPARRRETMAFDFSRLASSGAIADITEPATLFDALPNKADGYGYLRAVQKTVLDAWSLRRDERDVVIKTNTGGGKTIVGLLMLQCCLHEKKGPALYLAPDPHLAQRVCDEAANLGLAVATDPEAGKFISGDAICVTTMRTLVNGRTRFGLAGPSGRQPIRVSSIVIDDAHAALALTGPFRSSSDGAKFKLKLPHPYTLLRSTHVVCSGLGKLGNECYKLRCMSRLDGAISIPNCATSG